VPLKDKAEELEGERVLIIEHKSRDVGEVESAERKLPDRLDDESIPKVRDNVHFAAIMLIEPPSSGESGEPHWRKSVQRRVTRE
jgi:hypothetical protein